MLWIPWQVMECHTGPRIAWATLDATMKYVKYEVREDGASNGRCVSWFRVVSARRSQIVGWAITIQCMKVADPSVVLPLLTEWYAVVEHSSHSPITPRNARRGVFDSEHLDELHYGSLPDIGSDRCVSVEIQLYSGQWIVVIAFVPYMPGH